MYKYMNMGIRLVIKFTTVSEEFIIAIPCPLVLMRVLHSDANVILVMMVLEHIAVISMNVNLTNAKTNNTASIAQVALTVPVDVDIEQRKNQPIRCVTISTNVYLA